VLTSHIILSEVTFNISSSLQVAHLGMRVTVFVVVALLLCLSVVAKVENNQMTMEELKPLFSIPRVGGARFHPTKKEMVYVSDESGVQQIYRVEVDVSTKKVTKPERLISTNNRCTSPRYLSDGSILFLHDKGGDENFQIGYMQDGKQTWLTNDLKAKHLVTKVTRRYLYFKTNSRDKTKFYIYRLPFPLNKPAKPEHIFTPTTGYARAVLNNRDESRIILAHHHSNVHGEILLLDLKDGSLTSITRPLSGDKPVRWSPLRFLNKKRTKMLVKTDYKSEFFRLAILKFKKNIKTSKPQFKTIRRMEKIKHDVLSLVTNHKTKASYIELNKDGYSELLRVRIGLNGFKGPMKKVVLPLGKGVIARGDVRSFGRGIALSRDGKTMAISMSNAAKPVDIYMLELNHHHSFISIHDDPDDDDAFRPHYWSLLVNLVPQSLRKMTFASEKLHKFSSFDETPIHYFLLKPDTKPPKNGYPTIIRLHGGPESQTRPAFNAINQFLVKNGFALVLPNVRGSRGYGRELQKRTDIDTDRLFIMGGSYGGYATLLSLVTYPDLWKGGVSTVGMSSLETFFQRTAKWRRKLRYKEYGNYETQRSLLKRISPINHAHRITCPVFFIHGQNDERVPVSEAVNMYNKIKEISGQRKTKIGENSVLLTFPDEGHGITKRANREKAYNMLVTWLQKNTK
jgi:pimeloyl-ACP methyl ester carboxylesterase